MKQKRKLFAFPGTLLTEFYNEREDVVFLDDSGWSVYSKEVKHRVVLPFQNFGFEMGEVQVDDIRGELQKWAPLWVRWISNPANYELLMADSVLKVANFLAALRALDIEVVLFHTGIPHHLDTSIVSVSCVFA